MFTILLLTLFMIIWNPILQSRIMTFKEPRSRPQFGYNCTSLSNPFKYVPNVEYLIGNHPTYLHFDGLWWISRNMHSANKYNLFWSLLQNVVKCSTYPGNRLARSARQDILLPYTGTSLTATNQEKDNVWAIHRPLYFAPVRSCSGKASKEINIFQRELNLSVWLSLCA